MFCRIQTFVIMVFMPVFYRAVSPKWTIKVLKMSHLPMDYCMNKTDFY